MKFRKIQEIFGIAGKNKELERRRRSEGDINTNQKEKLEQSTKDYKPLHQDNISKFSKGKNAIYKVESVLRKNPARRAGNFFKV